MGRAIAYLPSYFVDKKIIPAAAPFIAKKNIEASAAPFG
jgi:hypothetical protein